jgi:hypothetical protein
MESSAKIFILVRQFYDLCKGFNNHIEGYTVVIF